MNSHQTVADTRLNDLDGFRVEIDAARERADVILDRPPMNTIAMPQRDQIRRVFEALDEDDRVRVIVLRAMGEHFSSGGYIRGFLEALARACLEARLEHRCTGALRQAGHRRQSRLLLRRRLRDLARLRFPDRVRDLPIRPARAEARADPGLWRLGALAEDRRHHPHQGYRHALEAHPRPAGVRLGHRHRMRRRRPSSRRASTSWSTNCARSRRSRSARPKSSSTTPRTRRCRSPSSSKAIATAACANRTTFAKVSRLSTRSARRNSGAAEADKRSTTNRGRTTMKKPVDAILLAAVASTALCSRRPAQEPIKIGVVTPLSGTYAGIGQQVRWGLELAAKEINAAGGITGPQVELSSRTRKPTRRSPCRRRRSCSRSTRSIS